MSHIVEIRTELRDPLAVAAACDWLQLAGSGSPVSWRGSSRNGMVYSWTGRGARSCVRSNKEIHID